MRFHLESSFSPTPSNFNRIRSGFSSLDSDLSEAGEMPLERSQQAESQSGLDHRATPARIHFRARVPEDIVRLVFAKHTAFQYECVV